MKVSLDIREIRNGIPKGRKLKILAQPATRPGFYGVGRERWKRLSGIPHQVDCRITVTTPKLLRSWR